MATSEDIKMAVDTEGRVRVNTDTHRLYVCSGGL